MSLVVGAAAIAMAACSGGTPPNNDATPIGPFDPRPYAIDTQPLDPCKALPPAQADAWGIDVTQRDDANASLPGCSYLIAGKETLVVQFLKNTPAARLLPGAAQQEGTDGLREPIATTLDGFGAVESRLTRGSPASCVITVDTGPTSSVQFVYTTLDGSDSPADVEAGCDKARAFAHVGLQNLASG